MVIPQPTESTASVSASSREMIDTTVIIASDERALEVIPADGALDLEPTTDFLLHSTTIVNAIQTCLYELLFKRLFHLDETLKEYFEFAAQWPEIRRNMGEFFCFC
jgi:hypothetical protein